MAGADPLDRPKIDRLRRESQVRTLARQLLYREYPRRATPQLVEQVVRRVMDAAGASGVTRVAVVGAGMVGATTAARIAEARLCDHVALIDVAGDLARAMALDIGSSLPLLGSDTTLTGGESLRAARAAPTSSSSPRAARASPGRAAPTCSRATAGSSSRSAASCARPRPTPS